MDEFLGDSPSLEDYWRGIILFGKNVASYKFALAKSLLELAPRGKTLIGLEDLAEPFSRHICEHLRLCDRQSQKTNAPYPFLEACRQFNRGDISYEKLVTITAKDGFKVVLDKFHNLNENETDVRFFTDERRGSKAIALTDDLFRILESNQGQNLPSEVEARWRLVETAWELGISSKLIDANQKLISYDDEAKLLTITLNPSMEVASEFDELPLLKLLVPQRSDRRVNITSCRSALNGYQKGKCFYCFGNISIISGADDLADVDHFFPRILRNYKIAHPIDGVWNLVLACAHCNRGGGGKSAKLPHQRFLERLHTRNEFFICSHHPLKETLKKQTGDSEPKRRKFLISNYNAAKTGRLMNTNWQPAFEYPPAF
ncbi:hypothetical protein [Phormidium nigroviride]